MLRDALLVLGKDLRIEARAKVTLRQVAPFVVTVMVLFAFGLDRVLVRDANVADTVTDSVPAAYVVPGLIWLTLLFALLLVVSRSVSIEEEDGAGDALRLSGLDPENCNAESRAIVVHAAWYVSPEIASLTGMLGRSEGCFAVSSASLDHVLDRLGPGRLLFAAKGQTLD